MKILYARAHKPAPKLFTAIVRGQDFLSAYLIHQVFSFEIDEMRSLLIVGQICANPCVITMTSVRSFMSIQSPRRTSLSAVSRTNGLLGSTVRSGS